MRRLAPLAIVQPRTVAAAADTLQGPRWTRPHPSFSPDQRHVVYTSHRTGHSQVHVAEVPEGFREALAWSRPGPRPGAPPGDWRVAGQRRGCILLSALTALPGAMQDRPMEAWHGRGRRASAVHRGGVRPDAPDLVIPVAEIFA